MGDCAESGKQELLLEKEDSQGGASFGALMLRPSDSAFIPVGLRAYPIALRAPPPNRRSGPWTSRARNVDLGEAGGGVFRLNSNWAEVLRRRKRTR